jgi:adenosine deaminase
VIDFRSLPKVELHRHLEGSVRYATLKEIAREAGIPVPARHQVQVGRNDPRTLRSFLRKFEPLQSLYPSREAIERVAREAAEDAARDGIVHLELRFSPVHFARRMKADPVEVAGWIIRAARRGAGSMSVKFIVTLGRHHSPRENAPSVDAAIEHRGDVVALDVAGPEDFPLAPFAPLLKTGTRKGLGLTIHAGEARGPESVREALRLGATRLGHGVRAARDRKLLEETRRRGIFYEMCLTSNLQTGAVRSPNLHPLPKFLRDGHRVTLSTDDPQVSGTTLIREFREAKRLGLNDVDFVLLTVHAGMGAFLSTVERKDLIRRIKEPPPLNG